MRPEFERYFTFAEENLRRGRFFGPYPYPYPYVRRARWVHDQVPSHWRSDARYFLTSNVLAMVLAPMEAVGSPDGTDDFDLREALEADLQLIVDRAEGVAKERDRPYVSATSVSIALGQVAEKLRTASFQIWGPEAERGQR